MHLRAELDADVSPAALFAWVADLTRYPSWLDLVRSATRETPSGPTNAPAGESPPEPAAPAEPTGGAGTGPAAWDVVLVGRLGPFRRLKRLRMVRADAVVDAVADVDADADADGRVRFIRAEQDGKTHASWELAVEVSPRPGGSHLDMRLFYSGTLWGPPLQRLLAAEIEAAKPRLVELARAGVTAP